jgi:hypothetical protein
MHDIGIWLAPAGALAIWLAMTRLGKVSRAKAHELVAGGARLIDVRTGAEFA